MQAIEVQSFSESHSGWNVFFSLCFLLSVPETWLCQGSRTLWWSWFSLWATWLRWASSWREATLSSSASSWTSMRRWINPFNISVQKVSTLTWRFFYVNWFQSVCVTLKFLQLCHDFILKVCDTFLKFGLPLMVMPPPGVFYPALLATDPVSVDRLAYIVHRWEYLLHTLYSIASFGSSVFPFLPPCLLFYFVFL